MYSSRVKACSFKAGVSGGRSGRSVCVCVCVCVCVSPLTSPLRGDSDNKQFTHTAHTHTHTSARFQSQHEQTRHLLDLNLGLESLPRRFCFLPSVRQTRAFSLDLSPPAEYQRCASPAACGVDNAGKRAPCCRETLCHMWRILFTAGDGKGAGAHTGRGVEILRDDCAFSRRYGGCLCVVRRAEAHLDPALKTLHAGGEQSRCFSTKCFSNHGHGVRSPAII